MVSNPALPSRAVWVRCEKKDRRPAIVLLAVGRRFVALKGSSRHQPEPHLLIKKNLGQARLWPLHSDTYFRRLAIISAEDVCSVENVCSPLVLSQALRVLKLREAEIAPLLIEAERHELLAQLSARLRTGS